MMAGILLLEIVIVYLFYLFAVSSNLLFAIFCLVLFISGIVYLVYRKYREKIKIKPKEDVKYQYRRAAKITVIIFLAGMGAIVLIKSIILLITGLTS